MAELNAGARAYVDRTRAASPLWEISVDDARRRIEEEALEVWGEVDEVAEIADLDIDGIHVRVYRPEVDEPLPAVVYLHGGGWVVGTVESYDPFCRALAARTPSIVVSVDYRLAPEHPFPAAVDDAWAVTEWVATRGSELGTAPGRLVVAGDSAGGNLAAVVALRARDAELPLSLQVLIYPVTDAGLRSSGYARFGETLNLTHAKMKWYAAHYLGTADAAHPEASPLRADDLAGAAPALVQTAEYDALADEGEAYARRLREAGVRVALTRYDGQIHGFLRLRAYCGDQTDEAISEIAAAIRTARPVMTPGVR